MSTSIGIVGLPNAGKSTLFNALTKNSVPAENYPFCTIDPNVGVVPVPDIRVDNLSELFKSQKKIYAAINFIDIAGIVKNAHKGEGLGNQFLANIREVDIILFVLRAFEDENVIHTENRVDPIDDFETLKTELLLADLETISKRIDRLKSQSKSGDKEMQRKLEQTQRVEEKLSDRGFGAISDEEKESVWDLHLFSSKKFLIALNLSEDEIVNYKPEIWSKKTGASEELLIPFSAKLENELNSLDEEEKTEYLSGVGLLESTLVRLVRKSYETLGLITFLTAGEKETRAWPIKGGSMIRKAAGTIHTDFEKNFIKADVVSYEDLLKSSGWVKARELGLVRQEGRDYLTKDGDVVIIKHGG